MCTSCRPSWRIRISLLALIGALAVAFAPALAQARAGNGGSFGSRGSQTWSMPRSTPTAPQVAPIQRSMTPNAPGYTPNPGFAQPGYAGGRSPFMSGLLGGLIGAGLGGLLLGHGLFGGFTGFGSFIGLLIQIALIVLLVRWLLRLWRRPATAGGPPLFARTMGGSMPMGARPGPSPQAGPPVSVAPADYQQFEQLLKAMQDAWSRADLRALQQIATPEMVSYFAEQLAESASRGVRNTVSDVRLDKGDLVEAWREGDREYATVAMRFSMIDVTRDGAGRVVAGNPSERQTATEVWTFVRVRGGRWLLSAIQQAQ